MNGEKLDKNKELVLGQTADKPMRSIVPPISDSKPLIKKGNQKCQN